MTAKLEQAQLEREGYQVLVAATGEAGVQLACSPEAGVELVLMDIDLGEGIDGTQAAQEILRQRSVPIIFLSSHTEKEIVQRTEAITSYGYVVKNSNFAVLDASIKMAFRLHAAHAKIAREEARHKAMLANSADVVGIIGPEGMMLYESPNMTKWFGWEVEEIVGHDGWATVHPQDQAWMQQIFADLVKTPGQEAVGTFRNRCKDGTYKWVRIAAKNCLEEPAIAGILFNYHDITHHIKEETLFRETEATGHIGGWEFDVATLKQTWTDEVFRILEIDTTGGEPQVPQGVDYIAPSCRPMAIAGIKRVIEEGISYDQEWEVITARGNRRWVHAVGKAVREEGKIVTIRGSFQDITRRKEAELQVAKLLQEKELILREVHHRVKNNMNVIHALLTLQAAEQGDSHVAQILDDAAGRVHSMLLLYDRLYRGEDFCAVSLRDYFPVLIDEIDRIIPRKARVEVNYDFPAIALEPRQLAPLGIIVNELLTNAFKHAFAGRQRGVIEVTAWEDGDQLYLRVRDDGCGLPPNSLASPPPASELAAATSPAPASEYAATGPPAAPAATAPPTSLAATAPPAAPAATAPLTGLSALPAGGFGMQLVEMLVEQLGGQLQVCNCGGAEFTFSFSRGD